MRAFLFAGILCILAGCHGAQVQFEPTTFSDWWDSFVDFFDVDDALYKATGESDRARMYRHEFGQ
jgi:hypothetical protein